MGALVDQEADVRAPAAWRIVAVSNEADTAVNNAVLEAIVRKWRLQGRGPKYVKIGRLVRYKWRDVEAWLDSHTIENTAQTG